MNMRLVIALSALLPSVSLLAQRPVQRNAAEIELGLKKLNVLASVLYVAAHPDDENTRLIAYMSNEMLANTAYLAMTRGDGGQNLIGPEIREYLGIIRTQELLAARRVDGGQQFFTRANDFGYSKSPEETQEIWDRDQVLSDVIRTYRKFRPDVVITRFPTNGGGGHGHHTTSAILAHEAFRMSGDKNVYPGSLDELEPWSAKRLYLNTGRWWNTSIDEDSPGVISFDAGAYNRLLGRSYSEIAAESRTQHKSQGFGSTGSRGEQLEFLEYRLGDQAEKDIFEGIDTSWSRVSGGAPIGEMIASAIEAYDPADPAASVPLLLQIRSAITAVSDPYWKELKLREADKLIRDCLGLYIEVAASDFSATQGERVGLRVEAANRSEIPVFLRSVQVIGLADSAVNVMLNPNDRLMFDLEGYVPVEHPVSQPYWLQDTGSLGMFTVSDADQIGKPENDPAFSASFMLDIAGESISFGTPLIYKWNDPVKGELYRPFIVSPEAYINIPNSVLVFASDEAKPVELVVKAGKEQVTGELSLQLPDGWTSSPPVHGILLSTKGQEQRLVFDVLPPKGESTGTLMAMLDLGGKKLSRSIVEIVYDHIPTQTVFPGSNAKLVKIDLERRGNVIGYIQGAGDDIPRSLRDIGYEVWEMNDEDITAENLARMDAVVLGIRALNTRERLKFVMQDLLSYVENGGNLIVQYNTNRRLVTENFAPYPISLSRGRVSQENAPVRILAEDHPVIKGPNRISDVDFEDWVQERGLYFPSEWDSNYSAVLSSNDPGEAVLDGGLLVTRYGKGYYVYTGYSWFRELPAGVPGAFKIFANMLSLGKNDPSGNTSVNNSN